MIKVYKVRNRCDNLIRLIVINQKGKFRIFSGEYGKEKVLRENIFKMKNHMLYITEYLFIRHYIILDIFYVKNKKELRDFVNNKNNYNDPAVATYL